MRSYTRANMETAMCLWEALQELLGGGPLEPLARALVDEDGTPPARHVVIGWVDECEAAWEADRAAQVETAPYDWEHCPAFLERKLRERYPDVAATLDVEPVNQTLSSSAYGDPHGACAVSRNDNDETAEDEDDEEDPGDEPCPVNRRPKSTCPYGCKHGED
jgi:hypothetical protein